MNPLFDEQQNAIARIRIADPRAGRSFYTIMLSLIAAVAVITAGLCFYFQSTAGAEDVSSAQTGTSSSEGASDSGNTT